MAGAITLPPRIDHEDTKTRRRTKKIATKNTKTRTHETHEKDDRTDADWRRRRAGARHTPPLRGGPRPRTHKNTNAKKRGRLCFCPFAVAGIRPASPADV